MQAEVAPSQPLRRSYSGREGKASSFQPGGNPVHSGLTSCPPITLRALRRLTTANWTAAISPTPEFQLNITGQLSVFMFQKWSSFVMVRVHAHAGAESVCVFADLGRLCGSGAKVTSLSSQIFSSSEPASSNCRIFSLQRASNRAIFACEHKRRAVKR